VYKQRGRPTGVNAERPSAISDSQPDARAHPDMAFADLLPARDVRGQQCGDLHDVAHSANPTSAAAARAAVIEVLAILGVYTPQIASTPQGRTASGEQPTPPPQCSPPPRSGS
jgi:hypothetical protein